MPPQSEDCLYLNVFAPSVTSANSSGFPVMFWIYGGNLAGGGATLTQFDGSPIAGNQGVVVVTFNYRVNGGLSPTQSV